MQRRTSLVLLQALSLSRVVLAAVFLWTAEAPLRVGLVLAAAATDLLDGWIARHKGLVSRVGALVDPLADRIFVITALTACLLGGLLAPWEYGLLLVRDVATAFGFLVAQLVPSLRGVRVQARLPGKLVTTLQMGVLLAVFLFPAVVGPLVSVAGVAAFWAVGDYARALWRARGRSE